MSKERHPSQYFMRAAPAPPATRHRVEATWRVHLGVGGVLAAVAALLYYPSLHAPWYMDDIQWIVENPVIRNLGDSFREIFLHGRGPATFSFALNYRFGGTNPFGYHMVNLGLHVGCGLLVYLLLRKVVRESALLPALGALLFVAHPLQTQAVTYVVQRMTVFAALFFLLAIWLFVRARERLASGIPFAAAGHLGYYLGALIAGLCAVFVKENTAVLPAALYLYVTFFMPPATDRRRLLLSLLPFAAGPLALAAVKLILPLAAGGSLAEIVGATKLVDNQNITPLHYLVTEFSVLWIYIRMLFLPFGQALDHSYPVASLFELRHLVAGGGLAALGALALRLRRRQPLIAAGIGWFFLMLAVESSFIPLDPLFEHRLYLPIFGFVLVVLGLLRLLPGRRTDTALLAAIVLLCLPLSWQRNRLWADPIAFYRDNLDKVPHSETVLSDLAVKYLAAGRLAEAEPLLLRALERNPNYLNACIGLVEVYTKQGRLTEALTLAQRGLGREPFSEHLLALLGVIYDKSNNFERALQAFDQALALNPNFVLCQTARAGTLTRMGRWEEAEAGFRKAMIIDTTNIAIRHDIALVLKKQGKIREAEEELWRIVEIDRDNSAALFRLGLLALDRGDRQQAATLAQRLRRVDPQKAEELERIIRSGAGGVSDRWPSHHLGQKFSQLSAATVKSVCGGPFGGRC